MLALGALRDKFNFPVHLPVSIQGSALDLLSFTIPDNTTVAVEGAICKAGTLFLDFATLGTSAEWSEAMRIGFTCNLRPSSTSKLCWVMKRGQGSVRLVVSGLEALGAEQDSNSTVPSHRGPSYLQGAGGRRRHSQSHQALITSHPTQKQTILLVLRRG